MSTHTIKHFQELSEFVKVFPYISSWLVGLNLTMIETTKNKFPPFDCINSPCLANHSWRLYWFENSIKFLWFDWNMASAVSVSAAAYAVTQYAELRNKRNYHIPLHLVTSLKSLIFNHAVILHSFVFSSLIAIMSIIITEMFD